MELNNFGSVITGVNGSFIGFESLDDAKNEQFVLRCLMPRLLIPILTNDKIFKFLQENDPNFTVLVENQLSQLPYLIIEFHVQLDRVIPISIFLNKIINGKSLLPFLSGLVILEVSKNFIYQSKFLLPLKFFNEVLIVDQELNKMIRQNYISISLLPDCDEILIRISPNSIKSFFEIIMKNLVTSFGKISDFNRVYVLNPSFKKFFKRTNQELICDKLILNSNYCGSLFRNFVNFKYTLRTKSDCNLKIERILKNPNMEKSKDDDIVFIIYGPYKHNVEFAMKMIEKYTKKYANLKSHE